MRYTFFKFGLAFLVLLSLAPALAAHSLTTLSTLPEADALIYVSPQRILNDAAPRVMTPVEVSKMRSAFAATNKMVDFRILISSV